MGQTLNKIMEGRYCSEYYELPVLNRMYFSVDTHQIGLLLDQRSIEQDLSYVHINQLVKVDPLNTDCMDTVIFSRFPTEPLKKRGLLNGILFNDVRSFLFQGKEIFCQVRGTWKKEI